MKTFAKEKTLRRYQILGLPYRVDLCFVDHKLGIEIDEDDHPYYENDEARQKLLENHGFNFIKINLDPDPDAGFDLDVDIAKIYNSINELSLKLAVDSAEKPLKDNLCKRIIELHVKVFWGINMRQIFH